MSRVLLGVSGGIAAYKSADLLRRLTETGHSVQVVPTEAALNFVGAATWEALSGQPIYADVFSGVSTVPHVRLGRQADLVLVAPATADLLARAASGRADDPLTSCLLTASCPIAFAPAMHAEMWQHPATAANVETLRSRGAVVIDPATGRLTGSDSGPGRLPEPDELAAIAETLLDRPDIATAAASRDLCGTRMVITAGGTREALDPVRFVGNASSGRMGWALARAAALRGAQVDLVAANVSLPSPSGADVYPVTSTHEMADRTREQAVGADAVVMAAAPSDFRPADTRPGKIKKDGNQDGLELSLVQNPDILSQLVKTRSQPHQLLVGFAAETADTSEELVILGRAKLAAKGCDLLIVNAVGDGRVFDQPSTEVRLLAAEDVATWDPAPLVGRKDTLAHQIWDAALVIRQSR